MLIFRRIITFKDTAIRKKSNENFKDYSFKVQKENHRIHGETNKHSRGGQRTAREVKTTGKQRLRNIISIQTAKDKTTARKHVNPAS